MVLRYRGFDRVKAGGLRQSPQVTPTEPIGTARPTTRLRGLDIVMWRRLPLGSDL
jgi:hypothetical protein